MNWRPAVGEAVQRLRHRFASQHHTDSERHMDEFVGRIPRNAAEFEEVLKDLDFEQVDCSKNSWRKRLPEDVQLHAVFYDGGALARAGEEGYTYVYAHHEYQWDKKPLAYWQRSEFNGPEGVRRMKKLLDEYGVRHEPIRP